MSGNSADLGTILGVWAHPDDETYLSGGLMARAARGGATIACVTATRGESGSSDEVRWPSGVQLAATRTAELHEALSQLGDIDHTWLDYPDGGCAGIDDEIAVAAVCAVIERIRPDTVLTFGPDGITGHDDHKAASRWATLAAGRAGRVGPRVLYATYTPGWLARFRQSFDALGVFMGSEPPSTAPQDLAVHALFTGQLLDAKMGAILRQTSQVGPLLAGLGEVFLRESLAEESFRVP